MVEEKIKKIAFVWDWQNEPLQLFSWEDGLASALKILRKSMEIDLYTQIRTEEPVVLPHKYFPISCHPNVDSMVEEVRKKNYDVYLFFADLTRPALHKLAGEKPTALCFAGGMADSDIVNRIDLIFVESEAWLNRFRAKGIRTIQAFGVNTELFRPIKQVKIWDAIFPATFADWKRHHLFANALKEKGMACGWFQEHEPWCYQVCFDNNVLVLPHIPAYALPYFYNAAWSVVIPSNEYGGSQRTVLEAMACDIPVIVCRDSDKTTEYLKDSGLGIICDPEVFAIQEAVGRAKTMKPQGREYILSKWTERHYAETLEEGLKSIV